MIKAKQMEVTPSTSGKIKYISIPTPRWSKVSKAFTPTGNASPTDVAASLLANIFYDNPTPEQFAAFKEEIKAARKAAAEEAEEEAEE